MTNGGGNAALEYLLRTTPVYLSLHETEPTVLLTGCVGSEVAGNGYVRQPCTWTALANQTTALTADVVFEDVPDCVVRWFGVWGVASGSASPMLLAIQRTDALDVPDPLTLSSDQSFTVPAGELVIGPFGPDVAGP